VVHTAVTAAAAGGGGGAPQEPEADIGAAAVPTNLEVGHIP
jgi:hypothetical protein